MSKPDAKSLRERGLNQQSLLRRSCAPQTLDGQERSPTHSSVEAVALRNLEYYRESHREWAMCEGLNGHARCHAMPLCMHIAPGAMNPSTAPRVVLTAGVKVTCSGKVWNGPKLPGYDSVLLFIL